MAKLLICSQRMLGHIMPALGLGIELRGRGHEVWYAGYEGNRYLVAAAGLTFAPIGWDKYPEMYINEMMRDILSIAEREHFDCIICDSAQSAPAFAAEKLGIKWVSLQTTAPLSDRDIPGKQEVNRRLREIYHRQLLAIRKDYGLSADLDYQRSRGDFAGLSPYLHLITVYPELMPEDALLPASAKVVGPCGLVLEETITIEMDWDIDHRPLIMIATTSSTRMEYREITDNYVHASCEGLADFPYRVLVTERRPYDGKRALAANIDWTTRHPIHAACLPRTTALITSGGCGTLQKAIKHAVPMVIVPLGADHPLLARRCVELGIAVMVDPRNISANAMQCALMRLIEEPAFKENATALADRVSGRQPEQSAVESLLQTIPLS